MRPFAPISERTAGASNIGKGGAYNDQQDVGRSAYRDLCGKCGAVREDSQIGLEQTPQEYVAQLVGVFREVRRVLRKDGVAWLNLGDSYNSSPPGNKTPMSKSGLNGAQTSVSYRARLEETQQKQQEGRSLYAGLKPKDLMMIPARVAIALCDDGWYLRSEIVWAKPNPMPESVTDRPTRSHEMIYLLSKSQTYFYDQESIKEPYSENTTHGLPSQEKAARAGITTNGTGASSLRMIGESGRNKRSVWTVATHPYAGAHFATFPEALIEPCILAGSRVGDTVLDPFGGSGTTGKVATKHRRNAVLIELNPEYCKLIDKRTSRVQQTLPMEEAV